MVAAPLLTLTAALALGTPHVEIRSQLPSWRAPGAAFTISGFASRSSAVDAFVDGRPAAHTVSGRLGRFALRVVIPDVGRHRVGLRVGGERIPVGRLLVRPLTLAAVGDVTPGEQVGPAVSAHGAAYPWALAGARLRAADITTANLEGAVTTRGTEAVKEFRFRGPVALLTGARTYGGIDVMTLANNHSLDFGPTGLSDTLAAAARAGIATVGAGANATAARRPAFVEAGGLRVAFLGYSDVNPAGFTAGPRSPGTARADTAEIAADVRAARRRADIVVVWFHWGTELHAAPDGRQQAFAAAALNGGASVVLGAHPHVLGAVVRPARSLLVAWTLGNFVFPSASGATSRTAILDVRLGAQGVVGYRLVPARSGVQPALE